MLFINCLLLSHFVYAQQNGDKVTSKQSIVIGESPAGKKREVSDGQSTQGKGKSTESSPNTSQNQSKKNALSETELMTQKRYFNLHLNPSFAKDSIIYMNALCSFARLEEFRLISKRRILPLAGGIGNVELYSSNELMSLYGRRVRPQNKENEANLLQVEFVFDENKFVKERLIK